MATALVIPGGGPPAPARAVLPVLALGLLLGLASPVAQALPEFAQVRRDYRPSDATLLARDGQPLHTLRIDKTVRRRAWTPLAEISPALVRAVIVSEDKRFMEHDGIDWRAAGKAAWNNFWGGRTRGASTLTMQLAGLLDEDGQRRGRRSVLDKLSQSAAAMRLEGAWSKRQIIEAYLNLVPFRGELQGVAAMSLDLFGKWPHGLDARESALAAALLRAPNASPAVAARRACNLLREMGQEGGQQAGRETGRETKREAGPGVEPGGDCADLPAFAGDALSGALRSRENQAPQLALHLARKLLDTPGQALRSSLDGGLQQFAGEALRRHLNALRRQNVEDGAVVVLDNTSGEVLAWIGSSGDLSGAAEVDGVTALRQAGSTLKPFLYALAFETRSLTPASLIEDAPLTLDTGNGLYAPQNYEPRYQGWVSARHALAGSLNVPAVRTLVRLGPEPFRRRLLAAGFASLRQDGDWYGYSLALGSADVSLLMLANAYRSLANGGQWTPLRAVPGRGAGPIPCRREGCAEVFTGTAHGAFTPAASFLVGDILSDRNARAGTFGLESWLATPYWSAVKTGTSKDMRDNWCAGYSRRYTVAVWVGNASGSPMHDVSGISGAAPVWREIMDWLHRGDPARGRAARPSRPPEPPAGLRRQRIRFVPAREPSRDEWFIAGTEQSIIRQAGGQALARIAYPADGTVMALDPDIPPSRQRIEFRLSASADPSWQWTLDGKPFARATAATHWLPQPGRHRLSLIDARGGAIDEVVFEVRSLKGRGRR
ncbi:transglycosylase domain-containing protein [Oryzomicrobium sp.]|uniref:transglycosylase domain-containing protein n=1 Tax=Oryzomicrobium sp. TaxID=1911578 RepID=UPI0025DF26F8|nr:transglycosylase domain-containing protein [Oryzomicrobium sp.]MCE1243674.1 transglycosylase domain-containing protein [Oryzomicrobium sp.]